MCHCMLAQAASGRLPVADAGVRVQRGCSAQQAATATLFRTVHVCPARCRPIASQWTCTEHAMNASAPGFSGHCPGQCSARAHLVLIFAWRLLTCLNGCVCLSKQCSKVPSSPRSVCHCRCASCSLTVTVVFEAQNMLESKASRGVLQSVFACASRNPCCHSWTAVWLLCGTAFHLADSTRFSPN